MMRLGRILTVTRNKNAIVRIKGKIDIGLKVYDEKMREIGFIADIIGPVKSPYAVIKVNTSKISLNSLMGKIVYVKKNYRWRR
ncbi:MAG: hypothetical protein B6U94_00455 [Thermofilum sp. ex4484_79]|nr:MAG: hypothetical protein B6U94_00455 [Thermofilum sp. ex4484_79]